MDALDRAGRQAEFAAGTLLGNDGVHLLGSADDGIDRAGLDAQRAADTGVFVDDGDLFRLFFSVERLDFAAKQVGQTLNAFSAAGWTLVDFLALSLAQPALATAGLSLAFGW